MCILIAEFGLLISRVFSSVKSTYHVARAQVLNEASNVPNPSASLWKACANILSTRGRLSEHGIDIDTQCLLCDNEVETPCSACTIQSWLVAQCESSLPLLFLMSIDGVLGDLA